MNETKSDVDYTPAIHNIDSSRNGEDEKHYMDEKQYEDYYKTNEKLISNKREKVATTNEFREEMRPNADYKNANQFMERESPSTIKSHDQTYIATLPENLRFK